MTEVPVFNVPPSAVNGILLSHIGPADAHGHASPYSSVKAPLEARAVAPAETTIVVIAPGVKPEVTDA